MTKIVQLSGSDSLAQDQYTGAERELTVDVTNHDLRLHDGTTQGGHRIMSIANGDTRYHPFSTELTGLTTFDPDQRGYAVRLGPANYALREFMVNSDNMYVVNGNGYSGHTFFSLASTIQSEHEWTASQLYTAVCEFQAGINSDVSGNTFGTHTGPVVGDVTGQLTGPSNGTHTGPQIGDVDVRGATLLLDDAQIPLSKLAGLLEFVKLNGMPTGAITMWAGAIESIPAGWALCDGENGTPDLTDRFILGVGTNVIGSTGGTQYHNHETTVSGGTHDHGTSVDLATLDTTQIPAHTHAMVAPGVANNALQSTHALSEERTTGGDTEYVLMGNPSNATLGRTSSVGSGAGHDHGITNAYDGSHSHVVDTDSVDSLPPYYVLAYIMKL